MTNRYRRLPAALVATTILGTGAGSVAADELVLYCSPQIEWCDLMVEAFARETGINVAMTRRSSGETYAQIRAEAANPRGDIWWGGTGDPHLQAAEEELTEVYQSERLDELQDWAQRQAEESGYRTVGIYAGALGFGYNSELLEARGIEPPECWADLTREDFRGEIEVANPNSSGTAYTKLATLVQLMGEEEAFAYLRELHRNITQYTQSGSAPISNAARGEVMIGIVFLHDAVTQAVEGFPIVPVAPCEGTGYEIGSMSIIKDGPNPEIARQFYEFALRPEIQSRAADVRAFQVPSHRDAETPPEAPDLEDIQLIDYDFALYGSAEERTRLLARWDEEIATAPR